MTKSLADNDVVLLAGTDCNTPVTVSGFSLHDELESLTNVGLTNAKALESATLAAGIWMKSNTGAIQSGYHADMLLLSRNPLGDIRNTRSIEKIFYSGKVIDQSDIKQILEQIKAVNDRIRKIDL